MRSAGIATGVGRGGAGEIDAPCHPVGIRAEGERDPLGRAGAEVDDLRAPTPRCRGAPCRPSPSRASGSCSRGRRCRSCHRRGTSGAAWCARRTRRPASAAARGGTGRCRRGRCRARTVRRRSRSPSRPRSPALPGGGCGRWSRRWPAGCCSVPAATRGEHHERVGAEVLRVGEGDAVPAGGLGTAGPFDRALDDRNRHRPEFHGARP